MTYTSETELHCSRTLLLFSDVLQIAGDTCPMPCTPAKRCHDGMLGMGDVCPMPCTPAKRCHDGMLGMGDVCPMTCTPAKRSHDGMLGLGDVCPMTCTPAKRSHDGMLGMGDVSALMMACLDWVTFQVRQSGQHGSILSKNVVGDVLHLRDSRSLLNALSDVL